MNNPFKILGDAPSPAAVVEAVRGMSPDECAVLADGLTMIVPVLKEKLGGAGPGQPSAPAEEAM